MAQPFIETKQQPEVISLIRVSTAEQAAGDRTGVDRQRTANRLAAERHGIRIRREMVAIDVSGRHVALDPDFQQLFKDLPDPSLSGVLVAEQSRIFRPEQWGDYAILDHFAVNGKLIYTPEAVIDPRTSEGRLTLTLTGVMSGEELHKIRARCDGGKQELREKGGHPGGNQMLPRGVRFVRVRNENGKVVKTRWELDGVDSERVRRAYDLLFAGISFEQIAVEIGGGWSGKGIHDSLANPIWKGYRAYTHKALGAEYLPKRTAKNPKPKMRRKQVKLERPQLVKIDIPAIISEERWAQAQEIIAARFSTWRKSKLKNEGRDRFLAMGIGRCSCGQTLYGRYGSRGSHLDTYYCGSRHPKGPGCGMQGVKRVDMDAAIEELVVTKLLDADFLCAVWTEAVAQLTAPDPTRAKREEAKAKLEKGRANLLELVRCGDIGREEFKTGVAVLEAELRSIEAMLPPPVPTVDPKAMALLITQVFAVFSTLPFVEKRALLRGALKSITLDGRTIPSVTISGGYLGSGANSLLPSTTQLDISAVPDIALHFPQPIQILTLTEDEWNARREAKKAETAARQGSEEYRQARLARRRVNESRTGNPEAWAQKLAATNAWKRNQRAQLRESDPEAYKAFLAKKAAEQRAYKANRRAAQKDAA